MGYQTQNIADGTYGMTIGTFENITQKTQKLSDFVFVSVGGKRFSSSNLNVIFFGADGGPQYVKNDETMKTFCPEAYAAFGQPDSVENLQFYNDKGNGWYLVADTGKSYKMDDYPIVPGRGFNVLVGSHNNLGVNVTSSGAVADEDLEITIPDGSYQMIGNAMPTEIKLKDFTFVSLGGKRFSSSNLNVIFFGADGGPQYVKNDDTLKTFCPEAYAAFGQPDSVENLQFYNDKGNGWYLVADSGKSYKMDDYPIAAGRGFNVLVGSHNDQGVKVTIPSPLQDAEATK